MGTVRGGPAGPEAPPSPGGVPGGGHGGLTCSWWAFQGRPASWGGGASRCRSSAGRGGVSMAGTPALSPPCPQPCNPVPIPVSLSPSCTPVLIPAVTSIPVPKSHPHPNIPSPFLTLYLCPHPTPCYLHPCPYPPPCSCFPAPIPESPFPLSLIPVSLYPHSFPLVPIPSLFLSLYPCPPSL